MLTPYKIRTKLQSVLISNRKTAWHLVKLIGDGRCGLYIKFLQPWFCCKVFSCLNIDNHSAAELVWSKENSIIIDANSRGYIKAWLPEKLLHKDIFTESHSWWSQYYIIMKNLFGYNPSNYRLMSLVSTLSKIVEKLFKYPCYVVFK